MRSDKRISFVTPCYNVRLQAECSEATTFGTIMAKRFMSKLYLTVEKVTESLVGNIKVNVLLGLAANDKPREGVARSIGPLLTYLPDCPSGTKTSAVYPLQGSFIPY